MKKHTYVASGFAALLYFLSSEVSSPATSLRSPATTLSWILGHWTCKAYNYDSGQPQLRKGTVQAYFFPGPGGLTVLGRSLVDGQQQNDRMTWNVATSRWLDVDGATSDHVQVESALTAQDVDVNADGMVFSGLQQMGSNVVRTMVITARTGKNSFTERVEFYENDDWKTVDMTYCKRNAGLSASL